MKSQNYLCLDLELNNKNDGTVPKIIQVGVAIGCPTNPEEILTKSWYLNPNEPITEFISQLTGITDETIQQESVSHETVAQELGSLIVENQVFVNPVVWGGGGYGNDATELKDEFRDRNIDFRFFGNRVIDVKTINTYKKLIQGKSASGGLRKCMNSYKLKFEGTPHRAEIDALNTLRFFFYFLNTENKTQTILSQLKEL